MPGCSDFLGCFLSTGFLGCFEEGCLDVMVAFLAVPPKVFHSRIFICSSNEG
ncbi:hypothetical protein MBAV_006153 [Candidatus Magnetobacterium bavaricum]|uniref:Uncharacterized protein n=1 Tax=Candidatus Magnetobacterium bavaricum TaxID=29290 RepID=A0A0F3GI85_9BACT|nr:hypothetical protein MBAV_006153 [Candidatus Magnetobacterium bavaricum]